MPDKSNPFWDVTIPKALYEAGVYHIADWPFGSKLSLFWSDERWLVFGAYNSRSEKTWWGLRGDMVQPVLDAKSDGLAVRFLFQDHDDGGVLVTGAQVRAMLPHLSVGGGRDYKVLPPDLPSNQRLRGVHVVEALLEAVRGCRPDETFDPMGLVTSRRRSVWGWRLPGRLERVRQHARERQLASMTKPEGGDGGDGQRVC